MLLSFDQFAERHLSHLSLPSMLQEHIFMQWPSTLLSLMKLEAAFGAAVGWCDCIVIWQRWKIHRIALFPYINNFSHIIECFANICNLNDGERWCRTHAFIFRFLNALNPNKDRCRLSARLFCCSKWSIKHKRMPCATLILSQFINSTRISSMVCTLDASFDGEKKTCSTSFYEMSRRTDFCHPPLEAHNCSMAPTSGTYKSSDRPESTHITPNCAPAPHSCAQTIYVRYVKFESSTKKRKIQQNCKRHNRASNAVHNLFVFFFFFPFQIIIIINT